MYIFPSIFLKTNCNDVIILDFYRRKFHRNVFFLIKIKIEKMKFKDENSQQS